ncbi:NLR family CARD domain-containing protein 3 [Xyrauchen texanus]|uniref:NLR family CARD domain-containing protein 3 n=1 Tax=Xyrauchen texanus TaxID=154827 RepID=UPI002241DE96|nr:NLR family CARD domain-containing protein 3 [Xyrauchen texanus]XP_051960017.1 NLR family CARD domain-containing protein 3 [Xyrauchen texanus]
MDDDAVDMASDNSLPFGMGASAYGSEHGDEEGDYFPQRTLPIFLGYSEPVGQHVDRAESPASSYASMHSDSWSETWEDQEPGDTQVQLIRRDSSASSSDSFNSDEDFEGNAEERSRKRRRSTQASLKQLSAPAPVKPELQVDPNEKRHPAMTVDFAFKALTMCLKKLSEDELKHFKKLLWERYPERFRDPLDGLDLVDLVDKMLELCDIVVALKIMLMLLQVMNLKNLSEYLQGLCKRNEVRYELKLTLKRKYEMVYEGLTQHGQPVNFESIYTDLYISDGVNAAVNTEHEFRTKIEDLEEPRKVNRKPLFSKDVLAPEKVRSRHVRSVLSKGSPGSGKSFAVQRFILDWVDGKVHQDIFFLLPLHFRELNQVRDEEYTLMTLVNTFYPEMKEVETLDFEGCPVMFICDGLDDSQILFDFQKTVYWCDVNRPAPVQVLITNLIRGNLLYHGTVWVISRPGALDVVPPEYVQQLLEVRGFDNDQREAYFRKTIRDQQLAERVIAHIKSSKTLYIMCHLPLFCWVASKVLQQHFQSLPPQGELPKTLTTIYTSLLHLHTQICVQKLQNDPNKETKGLTAEQLLTKLAKLAYSMLEKDQFQMEKEHWEEIEIESYPAVVCSGLCSEYYREKHVLYMERVSCFAHPTIQEYLAALHVFISFKKRGKNVLERNKLSNKVLNVSLAELLKSAVDKAINSKNSNFDIFLRFLLGLSVEANQEMLKNLLQITTGSSQSAREETTRYIKKKMKEKNFPQKTENLCRCIDELNPKL